MELFVRLDPAHLPRLRSQAILKSCRLGRGKTSLEHGVVFDSADFALQRRGITVTIVRQGSRFVEIVQRGDAAPSHQEVASQHTPPPLPELPSAALQPVFSYRLNRNVAPLGGNLWRAEMTIDQVEIETGDRRENYCRIGFRLIEGKGAPLAALLQALADRVTLRLTADQRWSVAFDLLRDRPPAPVKAKLAALPAEAGNGAALRAIARAGLAHLLANNDCLVASGDAEAIHQMRVALRRLRSAMSLFKGMLNDPQSQSLRAELRWMQQLLGAARDGDVLLAEILQPLDQLYQFTPGYAGLRRHIEQMREGDREAMLAELMAPRFGQSLLRLACWLEQVGHGHPMADEPVRTLALATLGRRYRRVRKQMAQFNTLDETGRHACRIQIKKLRYTIDFFGGLLSDRRAGRFVAQLAAVQDSLGRLNDIATARKLLLQIAQHSADRDIAWAAGLVAGWHQHRMLELLNQVWDGWHEVEKSPQFWKIEQDGFK